MAREAAWEVVESAWAVMDFLAFTLLREIAFTATIWHKLDKREHRPQ